MTPFGGQVGTNIGDPQFIAPEILHGAPYTEKADLYCLAGVMSHIHRAQGVQSLWMDIRRNLSDWNPSVRLSAEEVHDGAAEQVARIQSRNGG
jgi:serine/threonine protein kinase